MGYVHFLGSLDSVSRPRYSPSPTKAREGAAVQVSATATTKAAITGTKASGLASKVVPAESANEPATMAPTSSAPASIMPNVQKARLPIPHKADETAAAATQATKVIHVEGSTSKAATKSWTLPARGTRA